MIDGILIFWFVLTGLSLIYITYDLIYVTPEAPVMKVGWWLVTLYTGPIGVFFYLLSCKEPLPGTHEKFIEPLWKQSLGSMVHCLAGDVTGIILAAIAIAFFTISMPLEIAIEYCTGFFFGLFIFQSLFMKNMMGGTYWKALITSFYPEFTSMNMIMAGMIPTMVIWNLLDPSARTPVSIHFWGKMSLATMIAGITAFSMNRWLVKTGLKHGMMTIRPGKIHEQHGGHNHKQVVSHKDLGCGLSSSDSENFAPHIVGFSDEANGQRPFASTKSTGNASKVPEGEGEKPTTEVKKMWEKLVLSLICLGVGILISILAWALKIS